MKYEVPVLNISRFSVENVVTTSGLDAGVQSAVNDALTNKGILGANSTATFVTTKLTMADWVK